MRNINLGHPVQMFFGRHCLIVLKEWCQINQEEKLFQIIKVCQTGIWNIALL